MAVALLDINVLVALMWPAHEDHKRAQTWFRRHQAAGWATCPFTETGFVRILSNPSFSRDSVSPREALTLLAANTSHPTHHFWPASLDLNSALKDFARSVVGHRQVSDAYLLALSLHHRGRLATMDRAISSLLQPGTSRDVVVEV